jgi:hypothetical protein
LRDGRVVSDSDAGELSREQDTVEAIRS